MSLADSPKLEYDPSGRPPEVRPPWLKRYGPRLILIVLIVIFGGLTIVGLIRQIALANPQGTLVGQVVDPQGQPLPLAQIFVSGVEQWVNTDSTGRFELNAIPAGEHEVIIVVNPTTFDPSAAESIVPVSRVIQITAGQTLD